MEYFSLNAFLSWTGWTGPTASYFDSCPIRAPCVLKTPVKNRSKVGIGPTYNQWMDGWDGKPGRLEVFRKFIHFCESERP